MPLPSGVVNCQDIRSRKQCTWNCVGIHWFSKINDVNVNATQICKDQGYDGKITDWGLINSKPMDGSYIEPLCGKNRHWPQADLNSLSNKVAWKCGMKGRYRVALTSGWKVLSEGYAQNVNFNFSD